MDQPWEECVSRCSRIEGSIATLASQVFGGLSANATALADMTLVLKQIQLQLAAMDLGRVPTSPVVPGRMTSPRAPLPQLCTFCCATIPRTSPTSSLRHMFTCTLCPASEDRYLRITEHLFTFKSAPLIGSPEYCCWCGCDWKDCKGNSSSPDARSKHRKLCHQATALKLRSEDPALVQQTRDFLKKQWTLPAVVIVADAAAKRARVSTGFPLFEQGEEMFLDINNTTEPSDFAEFDDCELSDCGQ